MNRARLSTLTMDSPTPATLPQLTPAAEPSSSNQRSAFPRIAVGGAWEKASKAAKAKLSLLPPPAACPAAAAAWEDRKTGEVGNVQARCGQRQHFSKCVGGWGPTSPPDHRPPSPPAAGEHSSAKHRAPKARHPSPEAG
jgi:hypothetical protein